MATTFDTAPVALVGRLLLHGKGEYPCSVLCSSVYALEIHGQADPAGGDRVTCQVDGLGYFDGVVTLAKADGFVMAVAGTEALRSRLAARLEWHRARAGTPVDLRAHPRIVPQRAAVTVRTSEGTMTGALCDVSLTGAAIRMPAPRPDIDQPVTVGKRHATVVRHFDDGIAVRFKLPIRPEDLTADLVL